MVEFRTRPLYSQVRDELARRIADGVYPVGTMIPNEFALSQELRISIGTVRKAVDILSAEKAVVRMQGRGTIVADRQSAEFRALFDRIRQADGSDVDWSFLHAVTSVHTADATEQRILQLAENDNVLMIERYRAVGVDIVESEICRLPAALFGDIEGLEHRDTTIECLAFNRGIVIGAAEERVSINAADGDQAETFAIQPGAPLLKLDRVVFDTEATPIEWRVAHCNLGDRYYVSSTSLSERDAHHERGQRALNAHAPERVTMLRTASR